MNATGLGKSLARCLLRGAVLASCLLLVTGNLFGAEFRFDTNRFGYITMTTAKDSAKVVFIQGNKQGEEVTWKGTLKAVDKETFVTMGGTTFRLAKLDKKVVNDGNRGINSGIWKLAISGKGKDFEDIKAKLPSIEFGDAKMTECDGDAVK